MTQSSKFFKEMMNTYVTTIAADVFANAVIRGLSSNTTPMDFTDSLLKGFQTATSFVAYPIATRLLNTISETYRRNFEDPKGSKVFVYVAGGLVAAGIVTAVNFPIETLRKNRQNNANHKPEPEQFIAFFANQIGPKIGGAMVSEMLTPIATSNSDIPIVSGAKMQLLVASLNFCAAIFSVPAALVYRNNPRQLFSKWYTHLTPNMILCESVTYFSSFHL